VGWNEGFGFLRGGSEVVFHNHVFVHAYEL